MIKSRKRGEIEYPNKLDSAGKNWLLTKPFGANNLGESRRTFRDFATILYLIEKHSPKAKKIIELGSGPGWLAIFLTKMGYQVAGYDISPEMVKVAKKRAAEEDQKVFFNVLDIEEGIAKRELKKNDVAIIYDALHHCRSDKKVLSKTREYLKDGGIIILAEPNIVHPLSQNSKNAVKKYGVNERGLSFHDLEKILTKIGYRSIYRYHASGQSFLPRNESFSETIKMIFYPILARFFFGKFKTRLWIVAEKFNPFSSTP